MRVQKIFGSKCMRCWTFIILFIHIITENDLIIFVYRAYLLLSEFVLQISSNVYIFISIVDHTKWYSFWNLINFVIACNNIREFLWVIIQIWSGSYDCIKCHHILTTKWWKFVHISSLVNMKCLCKRYIWIFMKCLN